MAKNRIVSRLAEICSRYFNSEVSRRGSKIREKNRIVSVEKKVAKKRDSEHPRIFLTTRTLF
jgi:hypothetical protein